MIARLPSFSAKAAPLWPKHLSRQPGHPICWPACRRAGCLQRAYPSHATEQDDATTELTVAGGPRVRIRLPPGAGESRANLKTTWHIPVPRCWYGSNEAPQYAREAGPTLACVSASGRDPTHKPAEDADSARLFALRAGSRPAPIGTPPSDDSEHRIKQIDRNRSRVPV
jgi:hypothetical protein